MKAYIIEKYGKQPIKLSQQPIPEVGEHDVLAEIYAASVNPVDFKLRDGKVKLLLKYKMPLLMGNDFSGVITQVGAKVTRFKLGDEIYARAPKNRIGTFAEFIAINEDAVALKPNNLSFEEAASIPLVALTAYQVLHDVMQIAEGDKLLIQAGAGGVGSFAIQLAKVMGAYVATTASDAGYELVKSLGADHIINYKKEAFDQVLHDYDAVFDTLGGESLAKAFSIVKPGGNVVSVSGFPNARFGNENNLGLLKTWLFSLLTHQISKLEKKHGVTYTFLFMKHSGQQLEIIKTLIETGKIKPIVDKVYPFSEAQEALAYSESGRAKGKIVIKIKSI